MYQVTESMPLPLKSPVVHRAETFEAAREWVLGVAKARKARVVEEPDGDILDITVVGMGLTMYSVEKE